MTTKVNMHEAKSQLSSLVARVLDGEQVTIARAGVPLVDLVPHRSSVLVFGLGRGRYEHDSALFDGTDPDIDAMFYGEPG